MIRNRLLLLLAAVSLTAASCGSRDGDVLEIRSEADLSGLPLSCSSGNYYEHKYSARKDLSLFVTNSEADAVQAVRQGLADVFVTDEVALSGDRLKELGMKKAFRGEDAFDVAYAVRKGDAKLLEQLNAFITSAKADGTLDAIIFSSLATARKYLSVRISMLNTPLKDGYNILFLNIMIFIITISDYTVNRL